MVKPVKNNRKRKKPQGIVPQPEWVEAFMILLLAKNGGSVSLPVERLKEFSKIKSGNATIFGYDEETKVVTISLPKLETSKSEIIVPKLTIKTGRL